MSLNVNCYFSNDAQPNSVSLNNSILTKPVYKCKMHIDTQYSKREGKYLEVRV